jgi:hypothetical protein
MLAKGNYHEAFIRYEKLMRPFVKINQQLGKKSAELMRSQEKNNLIAKNMNYLMQKAPGFLTSFFIHRSTLRIHKAAHAITLKKYDCKTLPN